VTLCFRHRRDEIGWFGGALFFQRRFEEAAAWPDGCAWRQAWRRAVPASRR